MNDTTTALGFRLEFHDNPAGYPVGYVVNEKGVRWRATPEECKLWEALEEARAGQDEQQDRPKAQPKRSK